MDLPVIVFIISAKDNGSRDFLVRRKNVSDALHWLVNNNPICKHLTIDYNQLEDLPEHGKLHSVRKLEVKSENKPADNASINNSEDNADNKNNDANINENSDPADSDSNDEGDDNIGIDRGPIASNPDSDIVYDENCEMSSFHLFPL